jgi:c-di-GMP-specific phosphodiesterase
MWPSGSGSRGGTGCGWWGGARELGLGALGAEAASAAVTALAQPQDGALVADLLRVREPGAEVHARLRMRGGPTLVWRGVWLEDGVRAAGAVAAEQRFGPGDQDRLTGLLDRPGFIARAPRPSGGAGRL